MQPWNDLHLQIARNIWSIFQHVMHFWVCWYGSAISFILKFCGTKHILNMNINEYEFMYIITFHKILFLILVKDIQWHTNQHKEMCTNFDKNPLLIEPCMSFTWYVLYYMYFVYTFAVFFICIKSTKIRSFLFLI